MKLKAKNLIKIFSLGLLLSPCAARAVEVEVHNAVQLQDALTAAQADGLDNTIFVKSDEGTYFTGGNAFTYLANEPFNLTLIGDGVDATVLDGQGSDSVLSLTNLNASLNSNITVQGMTIQNGHNDLILSNSNIVTQGGSITLDSCQFQGNQKTAGDGPGALFAGAANVIQITHNVFQDNSTSSEGGAFYVFSGGSLIFQNNLVQNNESSASVGGGSLISYGSIEITNSIIINNNAQNDVGGALIGGLGSTTLTNNTISGNHAGDDVGGLQFQGPETMVLGLYNNIIFGNVADDDIQDLFLNDNLKDIAQGFVVNSFNNDYSLLVSDCRQTPGCVPAITEVDNISADPLFVDLLAGNVQLGIGSPAIDAGDPDAPLMPATDFDGVARPYGTNPDMGALEAVSGIDANPKNVDFGEINVGDFSDTVIVTVQNTGVADLNITSMLLDDANNFGLNVNAGDNPCGSETPTIGGGASCTIGLFFGPDEEGQIQSQLTIDSDAPVNPVVFINLRGVGLSPSDINGGGCALVASSSSASAMGLAMMALTAGALMVSLRRRSR